MLGLFENKSDYDQSTKHQMRQAAYASVVKDHLLKVMNEDSWNKVRAAVPYEDMVKGAFCAGSTSEEAAFAIIVRIGLVMKPEEATKKIALRACLELEKAGVDMSAVREHLSPIMPELTHFNGHLRHTRQADPDSSITALTAIASRQLGTKKGC